MEALTSSAPETERAAWAKIAALWNCTLTIEGEVTDEARLRFIEAADPATSGIARMRAKAWLNEQGIIVDTPEPPPDPGETPPAALELPPLPAGDKGAGQPPAHPQAEDGVLGRMVLEPKTIPAVRDALNASDFSSAERMRLFAKLCALHERGLSITPIVLEAEFAATGMTSMLARDLLSRVMLAACPADALPSYFDLLKEYSSRRIRFIAARQLLADAVQGSPARESIARARATIDQVDEQHEPELSALLQLRKWPDPIDEAAYHGLAGEFVRLVAPRTEADPVAILAQFLICFGNLIGHRAHWAVDASRHYCNEYLVLCGLTSRGRKGTSWDITRLIYERLDTAWVDGCHHTGVASGEALVKYVRDPVYSQVKVGSEMMTTLEDAGATDKRALWIEDEFESVLAVMKREGSILSANLRKAWGGGVLENANKANPCRATGAHISMIGHITFDELLRCLSVKELGNGFANRFLWICSRRSKLLSRGGNLLSVDFLQQLTPLTDRLGEAVRFAGDDLFDAIAVDCTEEAWKLYDEIYPVLGRTRLGDVGKVTDRAEAHVRRLAVIYAILDSRPKVDVVHFKAALAFWDYCERSVRFIFGDTESDPLAEAIVGALTLAGPDGLSLTRLCRQCGSGKKTPDVHKAIARLAEQGVVLARQDKTRGKRALVFSLIRPDEKPAGSAR